MRSTSLLFSRNDDDHGCTLMDTQIFDPMNPFEAAWSRLAASHNVGLIDEHLRLPSSTFLQRRPAPCRRPGCRRAGDLIVFQQSSISWRVGTLIGR